jgi:hypothetical protein
VAGTEREWAQFVVEGPGEGPGFDWTNIDWANPPAEVIAYQNGFRMLEGETLANLLADYAEVAAATDELVRSVPSLDDSHPVPAADGFEAFGWSCVP